MSTRVERRAPNKAEQATWPIRVEQTKPDTFWANFHSQLRACPLWTQSAGNINTFALTAHIHPPPCWIVKTPKSIFQLINSLRSLACWNNQCPFRT
ncbi:hypothetical protein SCA6_001894 [Theobroma cacao]